VARAVKGAVTVKDKAVMVEDKEVVTAKAKDTASKAAMVVKVVDQTHPHHG